MKVLLFANTDWYLYNFRLALAQALRAQGHEVVLLSPPGKFSALIQAQGYRWLAFPLSRKGLNPATELGTLLRLVRLYRQEKPDLVHHFTIKCVLYGSLAARAAGVSRVINSVTGLGYVFTGGGAKKGLLRGLVRALYRFALSGTRVIFQNPDDQQYFIADHLVQASQCSLIRGSGVDMQRFQLIPQAEGTPLVVLPARLLWDKGVGEFVEAARFLHQQGLDARFALVGDSDADNPAGVPAAKLEAWQREGVVEWWGWQQDMPAVYAQAALVCLPSYYREGTPRTLVEAAAVGRAIVTTDAPGCREVVQDGVNGLLVPVRDVARLAQALQRLLIDRPLCQEMGLRGRAWVERDFSSEQVIARTLDVYGS